MKPLRALIIEDSQDDCDLLVRALQKGGYDLAFARVQTQDAMRRTLEQGWDIVFADWTLPEFSALEALAVLWERSLDVPLIIVSGTVSESTVAGALEAGATAFLLKGETGDLHEAVERVLRDRP